MIRQLFTVALFLSVQARAEAQDANSAPVVSSLTGLSLPAGSRLDKGLLNRAAAKTTMEMSAKEEGGTLGSKYEVYRLGLVVGEPATLPAVRTMVEGQGWTFAPSANGESWGWLARDRARFLLYFTSGRDGAWLYLAEVSARSVATSPAPPLPVPLPAPVPVPAPVPAAVSPSSTPPVGVSNGPRRFQFMTTNFDDGWVATENPNYVMAVRGALTVYLFYRVPMTEAMRPPASDVNDYFWSRDVKPRFDVTNENRRQKDLQFSGIEYLEGDATERATGRRVFVGMFVSRNTAGALPIVVVAPDKATFYQSYPQPADLERLLAYNKFAVAPGDLVGHWSESSGSFAQMYYVNSGNYAGMSGASVSAAFWINPDGSYRSQHKGATGMVGSMRAFQQEYRGNFRVNGNWEVAMTNRFEGRTEAYFMQFEVVKGGRILHLTDKTASGNQYHLGLVP